ncbi:anosmin-1 isoform X2 [Ochlerotatus camptorhynchus]|uniref:anosmin-1 isoform X2 n=1 Tax=Ochlerotatus camptorhynchus TaxID=644619 RepID=UPI0031D09278
MFKMLHTIGVLKLILIQHMIGVSSMMNIGSGGAGLGPVANRRHTDNLLIARCRSKCTNTFDKMMCESTCIRDYLENSSYKKYGDCPKDPLNRLEAICFNTCRSTDYNCPGVEKCCAHSCGMSCQSPVGLSKVRGLPPVPFHVSLREAGRSFRMAEIHWDISLEEEESSAIYFVVESRHHIGINFAERKLENDWQSHTPVGIYEVKRTGSLKRYVGDMKLKPGRWYQVRVAAVNELGTRGYSVVSKEFQLSKKPNPPQPPKNLTLGPLVPNVNGTYSRKIMWMLPRSDLPVEKYKISWSLYLNASSGARAANSSLFKEMATVSAPTRHYEIKGLQPNSIYYLQIHAVSVYGKRRLKSAASSELMDTTVEAGGAIKQPSMDNMLMNDASYHRRTKSGGSTLGLNYKFVPRKTGFTVRLTWPDRSPSGRYRLHLCRGTRDCLSKPMGANSHDVVVKKTSYEFSSLEFDTKYTVGLRHNRKRATGPANHHQQQQHQNHQHHHNQLGPAAYDSVRTFVTPKCEHFRKTHPDFPVECSV